MSNARYLHAVQDAHGLRSPLKHVLLALAARANGSGVAYPSEGRLADDTGMHRRAVGRLLHELEALGLVARVGERRSRHGRPVVVRRLELAALQAAAKPRPQSGYAPDGATDNPTVGTPKPDSQYPITRLSVPDNPTVGRIELPGELPRELPREPKTLPAAEAACESGTAATLPLDELQPAPAPGNGADPPGFAEFWHDYPRKVAKADARKAWTRAVKTTDPRAILDGLAAHRPALLAAEPRYRPHPATWLNGRRWEDPAGQHDEPEQPRSAWVATTEGALAILKGLTR